MGEFVGDKNYLALVSEVTWGTTPGTPTWVHTPVEDYKVKLNWEHVNSPVFGGLLQRKHGQKKRAMPTGSATIPMYGWIPVGSKSLAEYLLDWAVGSSLEAMTLPSKSIAWAEGPDIANKLHTGMRVASFTLSGSDGSPIRMALNLQGQDQGGMSDLATAPTIPTDRERLVEMLFEHCVCTIDSVETPIKGFTWTVDRAISVAYENNDRPQLLLSKGFTSTLQLVLRKTGDDWDDWDADSAEKEVSATLALKGLHNGTGGVGTNWTVGTVTFNRLRLVHAGDEGGKDIQYQPLDFEVLKPDSSSASLSYAFTEES